MTDTLIDRYVTAVTRRVPDKQRRDIDQELRAAIGDDVDARVERGQAPDQAEYSALTELGNPLRLAARYAQRTLALVGPETYPDYVRALRGLCLSTLPVVYVVLALVYRAHGENVWAAIFRPLGSTVTVAMYLAVGVTALFAAVDRAVDARSQSTVGEEWTPEQLPQAEVRRAARWSDVFGIAGKAALVIALLFVQRWVSPVTDTAGAAVPIVNPALWDGWIPYFMVLVVLAVGLQVVNVTLGRWNPLTAVLGSVLTLAGTVPLGRLFWRAEVLNHALTHGAGALTTTGGWISWLAILFLAVVTGVRLTEGWRGRSIGDVR